MLRHARADYFAVHEPGQLIEFKLDGQVRLWAQRDPPENPDGDTAVKYKHVFGVSKECDLPSEDAVRILGKAVKQRSFAEAKRRKRDNQGEPTGDLPSGYTYFGQFIFHDITAMLPSPQKIASGHWKSARSPALDLDSVLGGIQPKNDPSVKSDDRGLFSTDPTKGDWSKAGEDLPRVSVDDEGAEDKGRPHIADPRNDDFLTLAQIHLLILRFYNALAVRRGAEDRPHGEDWWRETRREWVRHVQWITLYDYLPRIIDKETFEDVLRNRRRIVRANSAVDDEWLPIEVAGALGRFGHSLIRDSYKSWNRIEPWHEFGVRQFMEFSYLNSADGLRRHNYGLPGEWTTNWFKLFDLGGSQLRDEHHIPFMARTIGTHLSLCLFSLPHRITDPRFPAARPEGERPKPPVQLATQSLLRGLQLRLAPAQRAVRMAGEAIGRPILQVNPNDIFPADMNLGPERECLTEATPLWFYGLREAECANGGRRLGPLAGRMVMETIHAAIESSEDSILAAPTWRPISGEQPFTMADVVRLCAPYFS